MHKWQLQDAKNKLSSLIGEAIKGKPQCITKRGEDVVVVISMDEYRKLKQPKKNLKEFLLSGIKIDGFEVERAKGGAREVDL